MSEACFYTDWHFDCLGILKQSSDLNGCTNRTYWHSIDHGEASATCIGLVLVVLKLAGTIHWILV